jgi:hypothetical protein
MKNDKKKILDSLEGKKATWIECKGEAHGNPYIDNCMICMPWWENYPICTKCKRKLTEKGFCRDCRKHYSLE